MLAWTMVTCCMSKAGRGMHFHSGFSHVAIAGGLSSLGIVGKKAHFLTTGIFSRQRHCFPTEQEIQEREQTGSHNDSYNFMLEITYYQSCYSLFVRSKSPHTAHTKGDRNQTPHLERRNIK